MILLPLVTRKKLCLAIRLFEEARVGQVISDMPTLSILPWVVSYILNRGIISELMDKCLISVFCNYWQIDCSLVVFGTLDRELRQTGLREQRDVLYYEKYVGVHVWINL